MLKEIYLLNRFNEILENYYFPEKKAEIIKLLQPLGIHKILDSAIKSLDGINETNLPIEITQSLPTLIFNPTFTSINEIIGKIDDLEYKKNVKHAVLDIVFRILFQEVTALINLFSKAEFLEIIEGLCSDYGYNFADFIENFKIVETLNEVEINSGKVISDTQVAIKKGNLKWNSNEKALSELIETIRLKKWIKNPNVFIKLFNNPKSSLKIICNDKYLDEISYLWFTLKKENFISVTPTKGYLKVFNNFCFDQNKTALRENILNERLKKISKNTQNYTNLITLINGIHTKLKKISNS